jgi:hypothetical protein
MTATEFVEEPVVHLRPIAGSGWERGFHTLSSHGNITAVDGNRMVFTPLMILRRLRQKLRRVALFSAV